MDVNVIQKQESHIYVMEINGEIDAYTAPQLKEALLPLTEEPGSVVEIDLSNTEYMDSTGLGIIIAALKTTKRTGGDLLITNMTPRVERLFRITGLDEILKKETKEGQS